MADTKFVKGAIKLSARIRRVRASVRETVSDGRIPKLLLRRTKDRFNRQVDPDEHRWAAITPATLARKRRGTRRRKVLHDTLRLKNSIDIIKGLSALASNTGASARIGVSDPVAAEYARFHQTGTGGQVQRRFLGIGRSDVQAVDVLLTKAITRANNLRKTK